MVEIAGGYSFGLGFCIRAVASNRGYWTSNAKYAGANLIDDMATCVHVYPFLYAHLFTSVEKFSSVMNQQVTEHFLYATTKTVSMDVPPPMKVGSCRALSEILTDSSGGNIQPHALDLVSSLIDLLNNATDETVHLVLETPQAAVKAGHGILASIEPVISPIILNMWASRVSNPFISIDTLEVLETPAQVAMRWVLQMGRGVLPNKTMRRNLKGTLMFSLDNPSRLVRQNF